MVCKFDDLTQNILVLAIKIIPLKEMKIHSNLVNHSVFSDFVKKSNNNNCYLYELITKQNSFFFNYSFCE